MKVEKKKSNKEDEEGEEGEEGEAEENNDEESNEKNEEDNNEDHEKEAEDNNEEDQEENEDKEDEKNENEEEDEGEEKDEIMEDSVPKNSRSSNQVSKAPYKSGPFQRIDPTIVNTLTEDLKDNSFHAKFKHGGGDYYGIEGHEKLKDQVGKGFRKEKNKLKNKNFQGGKGGKITYQVNSVKL